MNKNEGSQTKLFPETPSAKLQQPMECLGLTFNNDEERRNYFLEILRKKLKDPEFRQVEGFPIGSDEDILSLSDPPYYTACPNPFIGDFIKNHGKPYNPESDKYKREPFASDISEGKNDPIYNAHPYHTKVPYKAVMRYILHYTEPGDVIFDGFCGTGMTGVAAQLCGDKSTVESLGYKLNDDIIYSQSTDENGKVIWTPFSRLGMRHVILNDLSPAATFIAANYNRGFRSNIYYDELQNFTDHLRKIEEEYWTVNISNNEIHNVAFIVWSDIFYCNNCSNEIIFWDSAVDKNTGKVLPELVCTHCGASFMKRSLSRPQLSISDGSDGGITKYSKIEPVLLGLSEKRGYSNEDNLTNELKEELIKRHMIEPELIGFPDYPLDSGWEMYRHGMGKHFVKTHRHLYIPSNAATLNKIWSLIQNVSSFELRNKLRWIFTNIVFRCSKFNRRLPSGGGAPITGVLYIPSMIRQENPVALFHSRIEMVLNKVVASIPYQLNSSCIQTGDLGTLNLPKDVVDYAFIDPPFGSNIYYADMNFLWESWLSVFTDRKPEAIISDRALSEKKSMEDYGKLMFCSFNTLRQALKPGRWLTVEFHNSSNTVWNVISESLQRAGFVVADVRTLDKKQKSFRQTTAAGAVKQDLIISAYKPDSGLEKRFRLIAQTEDGVWDFLRSHLKQLPTFVSKDGQVEVIAERKNYLLFDRMVAFHVQRGARVPISAAEFYQGLTQRFPERDGMYFLSEQVAEYDKKRMTVKDVLQLQLIVTDESSAIQWLKQQLTRKPQTFQELHPQFIREIGGWQKHEKPLELSQLLEQNFLRYDGIEEVPSQIHSYLSTNFRDLRKLNKDDPALIAKAKNRWYVPDPNKAGDLEKLRERSLLKEFEEYRATKQKRLKVFRLEAVRAGFKKAWQERDYITIIEVADKVPEKVLQEDPKLLMWYDQALTRRGEGL